MQLFALFPTLVRTDPPRVHLTAVTTGGLQQLYKTVKSPRQHSDNDKYTDAEGRFTPTQEMVLLASRYCFIQVIGRGQSSVLIKAQDTFRGGALVSIKVLHIHYSVLGTQEADCIRRLNQADVHHFSGTLRLYTMFQFDGHYCLVFELLQPQPLHKYFLEPKAPQKLHRVRQVAVRLLSTIGFLQQQNVIHADLKPDNLLLQTAEDCRSVKLIDFGNAIRCVHNELSLYYDDFELQTLLYRAPEVMMGVPFSMEVDLWSMGCILVELYIGQPLFRGRDTKTVLHKMVQLLGPLPVDIFQRGKFFPHLHEFTAKVTQPDATSLLLKKLGIRDYAFANFIAQLLAYDPRARNTVTQAAQHPFLAPEVGISYLIQPSSSGELGGYQAMWLSGQYQHKPCIASNLTKLHMSPLDLLRCGTSCVDDDASPHSHVSRENNWSPTDTVRQVAQVTSLVRQQTLPPAVKPASSVSLDPETGGLTQQTMVSTDMNWVSNLVRQTTDHRNEDRIPNPARRTMSTRNEVQVPTSNRQTIGSRDQDQFATKDEESLYSEQPASGTVERRLCRTSPRACPVLRRSPRTTPQTSPWKSTTPRSSPRASNTHMSSPRASTSLKTSPRLSTTPKTPTSKSTTPRSSPRMDTTWRTSPKTTQTRNTSNGSTHRVRGCVVLDSIHCEDLQHRGMSPELYSVQTGTSGNREMKGRSGSGQTRRGNIHRRGLQRQGQEAAKGELESLSGGKGEKSCGRGRARRVPKPNADCDSDAMSESDGHSEGPSRAPRRRRGTASGVESVRRELNDGKVTQRRRQLQRMRGRYVESDVTDGRHNKVSSTVEDNAESDVSYGSESHDKVMLWRTQNKRVTSNTSVSSRQSRKHDADRQFPRVDGKTNNQSKGSIHSNNAGDDIVFVSKLADEAVSPVMSRDERTCAHSASGQLRVSDVLPVCCGQVWSELGETKPARAHVPSLSEVRAAQKLARLMSKQYMLRHPSADLRDHKNLPLQGDDATEGKSSASPAGWHNLTHPGRSNPPKLHKMFPVLKCYQKHTNSHDDRPHSSSMTELKLSPKDDPPTSPLHSSWPAKIFLKKSPESVDSASPRGGKHAMSDDCLSRAKSSESFMVDDKPVRLTARRRLEPTGDVEVTDESWIKRQRHRRVDTEDKMIVDTCRRSLLQSMTGQPRSKPGHKQFKGPRECGEKRMDSKLWEEGVHVEGYRGEWSNRRLDVGQGSSPDPYSCRPTQEEPLGSQKKAFKVYCGPPQSHQPSQGKVRTDQQDRRSRPVEEIRQVGRRVRCRPCYIATHDEDHRPHNDAIRDEDHKPYRCDDCNPCHSDAHDEDRKPYIGITQGDGHIPHQSTTQVTNNRPRSGAMQNEDPWDQTEATLAEDHRSTAKRGMKRRVDSDTVSVSPRQKRRTSEHTRRNFRCSVDRDTKQTHSAESVAVFGAHATGKLSVKDVATTPRSYVSEGNNHNTHDDATHESSEDYCEKPVYSSNSTYHMTRHKLNTANAVSKKNHRVLSVDAAHSTRHKHVLDQSYQYTKADTAHATHHKHVEKHTSSDCSTELSGEVNIDDSPECLYAPSSVGSTNNTWTTSPNATFVVESTSQSGWHSAGCGPVITSQVSSRKPCKQLARRRTLGKVYKDRHPKKGSTAVCLQADSPTTPGDTTTAKSKTMTDDVILLL